MEPMEGATPKRLRSDLWTLAVPLALGAFLRLWGLRWGLPDETHLFSYHPDEYHSLRAAIALATGDLNPHFFNYGSLYLYLVAVACLWHETVLGGPDLISALVRGNRADLEMADWTLDARLVVVVCALITVWVAWLIGRRLAGTAGGLLAGLAMAALPLHVLHSHYATVDVPQALFMALCLYLSLTAFDDPRPRRYLWAGIAAGLAASVKYNGAVVLVAPLTVLLLTWRSGSSGLRPAKALLLLGVGALASFALTSPYVFLAWPEAWRDISFELQHMRAGESPIKELYPNGWLFHWHPSLVLGAIALWASARQDRRNLAPLGVFGLVWFAMIGAAGVRYARYEMALEPLTAVFVAMAIVRLWRKPTRSLSRLGAGALSLWCVAALLTSVQRDYTMATVDPRAEMLAKLETVRSESEPLGVVWEPWFNLPAVDYNNGGSVLRSNPIYARFNRPAVDYTVTGVDAAKLAESVRGVLISDFEMDDGFQSVSRDHKAFTDKLWGDERTYRVAAGTRPVAIGDHPLLGWTAPDSRYPFPRLTLLQRVPSGE
jgi:hypothetical protein